MAAHVLAHDHAMSQTWRRASGPAKPALTPSMQVAYPHETAFVGGICPNHGYHGTDSKILPTAIDMKWRYLTNTSRTSPKSKYRTSHESHQLTSHYVTGPAGLAVTFNR
jgi:hypothetical protein